MLKVYIPSKLLGVMGISLLLSTLLTSCGARPGAIGGDGIGNPSDSEIQAAKLFRVEEQIAMNSTDIELPPVDGGSSSSSFSSDSSSSDSSSSSSDISSSSSDSSSSSSDSTSSSSSSTSTSSSSSSEESSSSSSTSTSSSSTSSSSSDSSSSSSSTSSSSSSSSEESSSSSSSTSSSSSEEDDDDDDTVGGMKQIHIRRACWDRPRDWPTVRRADDKAIFALKSANKKVRYNMIELKGSDFYRKTPVIMVSKQDYKDAHWVEVCQADSKNKCRAGNDGDFDFEPGLIVEKVGTSKDSKTVSKLPYRPEELKLLQKVTSSKPLEIIVENIGQYSGSKRNQIRADYCDVVYKVSSPLALDFSGKGFLPGKQSQGPAFDVDGDGFKERMSSLGATAGLLALDLNGNELIDNGTELFGDATWVQSKNGKAAHGFEALAQYDLNQDQVIDFRDLIYSDLRVWFDLNKNGISEASELKTLGEVGVAEIDLRYLDGSDFDIYGNNALQRSIYRTPSGLSRYIADIWFLTESIE